MPHALKPPLLRRIVSPLADGALLYALFYGALWIFLFKVSAILTVLLADGVPDLLEGAFLPFALSFLAAFVAHVGLRLALLRLRRRLASSESAASLAFLALLTASALFGFMGDWLVLPDSFWWSPVCVVSGAWAGALLRRRVSLR
jgi:hypothetical protein